MHQIILLCLKRSYNLICLKRSHNLTLMFLFVAILLLNIISLLMVPHYTDSHGIRDLIWSNEAEPILSPRDACNLQHNTSMPEILVLVPSGLMNFERRSAIRNSWADTPLVREGKIKVIFILGQKLSRHGTSQVFFFQRLFGWVA